MLGPWSLATIKSISKCYVKLLKVSTVADNNVSLNRIAIKLNCHNHPYRRVTESNIIKNQSYTPYMVRKYRVPVLHRVLKKQAKLFLLQLRQTSTRSDNFWHKDGKQSDII